MILKLSGYLKTQDSHSKLMYKYETDLSPETKFRPAKDHGEDYEM